MRKKSVRDHLIKYQLEFFIYNIVVMFLVLIHSLGYFDPYFPISANIVILLSVILAVLILHIKSDFIFLLSFAFWIVSMFFKVIAIDVWAERVAMYTYQTLLVGFVLYLAEEVIEHNLLDIKKLIFKVK